ncbi:MAG: two-component system phosphate regulon sensor histidine kinase PhoR [Planctomycetota bacterium]|jgi:two-component system phosphate regulon sensor histidine kinase PhoR
MTERSLTTGTQADLEGYRVHVKRQIDALNRGLTRVLFGDLDVVLRAADADIEFGNLAMMTNVAINSARLATREKEQLLDEIAIDRSRLDAILESTDAGILCFLHQGDVIYANASFSALTGIDTAEVVGQRVEDIGDALGALLPQPDDAFTRMVANPGNEPPLRCSVELPTPRAFRVITRPVVAGPDSAGYLLILRDITQVEDDRRAREELLGNLAHEIRTPLTSIHGFVDLLLAGKMGPVEDAQRVALDVVSKNVGRLVDLAGNLLDVDRMQTGAVDRSPTPLGQILDEVLEGELPRAMQKQLEVEVQVQADLIVLCGRSMLRQILRNLISNAIKYTPGGSIRIRAERLEGEILVECSDTGIGMSEEDQQCVFNRFFRSDNEVVYSVGGTGVGLSIVRRFVESVGGSIELESSVGSGSTFRVFLPVGPAEAES